MKELRKEIAERDERIEELHIEYKAKIQVSMIVKCQSAHSSGCHICVANIIFI